MQKVSHYRTTEILCKKKKNISVKKKDTPNNPQLEYSSLLLLVKVLRVKYTQVSE